MSNIPDDLSHPLVNQIYNSFKTYPSTDVGPHEPMMEWQQIIEKSTDFANLKDNIKAYQYLPLVGEAMRCLEDLTDGDWIAWQEFVFKNRASAIHQKDYKFEDNEMMKFACLLVPPTLLQIVMIADRFQAPFVIAMEQMARADKLQVVNQWIIGKNENKEEQQ